jgi:hypothetical protein
VIETGCAIELRNNRRQLGPKPPLVAATADRFDASAPPAPPRRDEARERLHDQHLIAVARQQSIQQRVPR